MFRVRTPTYNLKALVTQIMETDFSKALLKSYLKGRTLWCASQLAEILPKDYAEVNNDVLDMAVKCLIEEQVYSVKLAATRCIVKYSRKVKLDFSIQAPHVFE